MAEVIFQAEFSKIGTGSPLAKESAGSMTGRIVFEFNAMEVELDALKSLKSMGQLEIVCRPVNADLFSQQQADKKKNKSKPEGDES